jgi:chaperonin GroES
MSIESIVELIGAVNIAEKIPEDKRQVIADAVITRANQDWDSMSDWRKCVEEGIKLCKPEFDAKSYPWPGAANFKSTILVEAANNFGNRATIELMRDPRLVKSTIIGLATIKNAIDKKASDATALQKDLDGIMEGLSQLPPEDPQVAEMQKVAQQIQQKITENTEAIKEKKKDIRSKNDRSDRVTEFMNWQVNVKMPEWRADHKRLLYSIGNAGCLFKKTFYDETLGRCVSKVIKYPDFRVNQRTEGMTTCRSFTHVIPFTKAEVDLRVAQGIWLDVEIYQDDAELDAGGDEASESKTTDENPDAFYEQYCWLDLDKDGTEEPYILTVHAATATLVRAVARFDEDSIIVKSEHVKPMALLDAQRKRARMIEAENKEFGIETPLPDPSDLSEYKIVRVEPVDMITKYGLIPSADGSFLDVGFYHIIGSMTLGVNKTTNDLLNSGTLANQQGGVVAKNFRGKQKGNFSVKPGEFIQSEVSADALHGALLPLPFKEPSATLFQLNEKMSNEARQFSTTADLGGNIQANTAPTTALAMIQESLIPNTAHMSMIVDSMGSEFEKIFKLNRIYSDADDYKEIVGDEEAVFSDDFDTDGLSIVCSANPEMSSRMQRISLSEAEMVHIPMVIQAGGNPIPILKNYYKRIGSNNLDEIFPNEAEMSPEEKQQMEAMRQQQEMANQLAQQQSQMIALQTELLKKGEERKDFEAQIKALKTQAETGKVLDETTKVKAETLLTLEQAETEATKNQINIYTTRSAELTKAEEALTAPEVE